MDYSILINFGCPLNYSSFILSKDIGIFMKKKYIPVTFSRDELNYFTLAIVLKVINDVQGSESFLFFREYFLGTELFIEEKYFSDSVDKIKNALFENSINIEFRKPLTELLEVLVNTIESGVKFVELADTFKVKLTPYYFKLI